MAKITIENVLTAVRKLRAMSPSERVALADEIFERQPILMDSCLLQHGAGVANGGLEHTTDILLVCFQSMKESGFEWPRIPEDEQQRQLTRVMTTIELSKRLADPDLPGGVTQQYLISHPEQPLLTDVLEESNSWLQQIGARKTEAESDQQVLMACINFVNCIAYTEAKASTKS